MVLDLFLLVLFCFVGSAVGGTIGAILAFATWLVLFIAGHTTN